MEKLRRLVALLLVLALVLTAPGTSVAIQAVAAELDADAAVGAEGSTGSDTGENTEPTAEENADPNTEGGASVLAEVTPPTVTMNIPPAFDLNGKFTEKGDTKRTALIGTGETLDLCIEWDSDADEGSFKGVSMKIQLPYFYYKNGILAYTYDFGEIPPEQQTEDMLMGVEAQVYEVGTAFAFCDVDTETWYRGDELSLYHDQAGTPAGEPATMKIRVRFFHGEGENARKVPENTMGLIRVGGGYDSYTTAEGTTIYPYFETPPEAAGETASYKVINSNLEWDIEVEQVEMGGSKPVLWDEYNYMTYKLTIRNTSEDDASFFESFDLNFNVPCVSQGDGNHGLRDEDALAWYYDEDGVLIQNPDLSSTNWDHLYGGKPMQGGVLVYDVTGIDEDILATWDTETYSYTPADDNPTPASAQTIGYRFLVNRLISIPVEQRMNKGDERTYYIAIPFVPNFPQSLNGVVSTSIWPTVYFAKDLSWTKYKDMLPWFEEPNTYFTHDKYLLDEDGNHIDTDTIGIGDTAEYYISGFSTVCTYNSDKSANLPVFNATVIDELPELFELKQIAIEMNIDPDDPDDPKLEDWFKTVTGTSTTPPVELEIDDGAGNISFVAIGQFTPTATATSKVWTLDVEAALAAYKADNPGATFTNRIRINLAERINKAQTFDGHIKITGVAPVLETYTNTINTTVEQWIWGMETDMNEPGYVKTPFTSEQVPDLEENTATVITAPGQPLIDTKGYYSYGGSVSIDDPQDVPLLIEGAGFIYSLGNASLSDIMPAIFKSGNLLEKSATNNGYYGLDLSSIVLSKELLDVAEVSSVVIHGTNTSRTIAGSSLSQAADGSITIPASRWSGVSNVYHVTVNFSKFGRGVTLKDPATDEGAATILLLGKATRLGEIKVNGTFENDYNDNDNPTLDTPVADEGALEARTIAPELEGWSYSLTGGESSRNTPDAAVKGLTVANKLDDTGYRFEVANASDASAGEVYLSIDLSGNAKYENVGDKNADPDVNTVKGFNTTDVYLSENYAKVGELKQVEFWDWNQDPTTDAPKLTVPVDQIGVDAATGRLHIKEEVLRNGGLERVLMVRVVFSDFYGQEVPTDPARLLIELNGVSDWFDQLDAVLTFEPTHPTMSDQITSVTARLYVKRPALMVHTNILYYNNVTETEEKGTAAANDNADKGMTRLGIPYDRDFVYRVSIENAEISVLDDVVLTVELPIAKDTATSENIGFHTTKVVVQAAFFEQFGEPRYNKPDGTLKPNTLTLTDVDGKTTVVFEYDAVQKIFVSEDGKHTLELTAKGDLEITEEQLVEFGITELKTLVFDGDGVKLKDETTPDAYIDFHGYSDSVFGTEDTITADSKNYLDGLREDRYIVAAKDTSKVTVSKMYFDTVLVAGYKDSAVLNPTSTTDNGLRFDQISNPVEHIRVNWREGRCTALVLFNDDVELDIGYKAIGSYMLDFRQYLNVGTDYPDDYQGTDTYEAYHTQEHAGMNWVYTQSLNTAANVEMTLDINEDMFDAYYVKVHPWAFEYLNSITLIYKNGTKDVLEKVDWEANASSVETVTNDDGTTSKYYVIDLVDGMYKSPEATYTSEGNKGLSQVIFNLDINQEVSADGINALDPDYGTWLVPDDQSTRFMFEVTGRFYKVGTATATASTKLTVGDGERSKIRVESEDPANANDNSSAWSYKNWYWWGAPSYPGHSHGQPEYDARHLRSTANVCVKNDANKVIKGVHADPTLKDVDRTIEYAEKAYYTVSFYRTSDENGNKMTAKVHAEDDYVTATNSSWREQDQDDWTGKVSFLDAAVLTDTLPPLEKTADDYKGFRTEDIQISADLYKDIDKIELYNQAGDLIKEFDLTDKTANPLGAANADGYYEILFLYEDEGKSSDDVTAVNQILLPLGSTVGTDTDGNPTLEQLNTYLGSYKIYMSNIPGNADYASEYKGKEEDLSLVKADAHGTASIIDIKVGGYVHTINVDHDDKYGTNTITSAISNDYQDDVNILGGRTPTWITQHEDTALLMGFQKEFKAGHRTERIDPDADPFVSNPSILFSGNAMDYDLDNMTPTYTSFGVMYWNRPDGDTIQQHSARIASAKMQTDLPTGYHLKRINFPAAFVTGDWFQVSQIRFVYNGQDVTLERGNTDAEEIDDYLVQKTNGNWYFDVEAYIKEHESEFSRYTLTTSSTDTRDYVVEHINTFYVTLATTAAEEDWVRLVRSDTPEDYFLMAGKYLTLDGNMGYSFTYDGIWVERSEEDFEDGVYSATSRPTTDRDPNGYTATIAHNGDQQHYTQATFKAADFNAKPYGGDLNYADYDSANRYYTNHYPAYTFENRVAEMIVRLYRNTALDEKGTFAYDQDLVNGANVNLGVDKSHLVPYDYINYVLEVGAGGTLTDDIPLQHTDLRFTVPDGQRIVGWQIGVNGTLNRTDGTSIADSEITATAKNTVTNAVVQMTPQTYYSFESGGTTPSNYKEINISLGNNAGGDDDQIRPGETFKIIVYTQLTEELATAADPSAFEGKTVTATYEAATVVKHTYNQYRISSRNSNGTTCADCLSGVDTTSTGKYHTEGDCEHYRDYTDFYRKSAGTYIARNYTAKVTSTVTFMDSKDLYLEYTFDKPEAQYDRQPMTIKLYGEGKTNITNDLQHTLKEITFEVSFMSQYNNTVTGEERFFKSFELTKKPTFAYPANMVKPDDVAAEDWVPEDWYLVTKADGTDEWVRGEYILTGAGDPNAGTEGYYTLAEVKAVRWKYFDVPAKDANNQEILFASTTEPFKFEGLGLYNDITSTDTELIADRYSMKLAATVEAVHSHQEKRTGVAGEITINEETALYGSAAVTTVIARERPVITYQTQIFETAEQAAESYAYNRTQKNGYRPGDTMWYKLTVINNKLTSANADELMQGVMLDPVFFDKIPQYVVPDMDRLVIRWLDDKGNAKTAPALTISEPETIRASDLGGDMVVPKPSVTEGARGNITGYNFSDIIPSEDNSTDINYSVYTFSFPKGTRLEVGESIEIWYPVEVQQQYLPMTYVDDGENVYPDYFPKLGQYYQLSFTDDYGIQSYPMLTGRSGALGDGHIRKVDNSGLLMDMNYLIHDAGISGTINPNVDKWEYLKDSTTYIPGASRNDSTGTRPVKAYGNNGRLMDYDISSSREYGYQAVVYTPSAPANPTAEKLAQLPDKIAYMGSGYNRDVFRLLVGPRVYGSRTLTWDDDPVLTWTDIDWDGDGYSNPVIWSEARSHLQTAWLATSSQIIPDAGANETIPTLANHLGGTYLTYTDHARKYLGNAYTSRLSWNSAANPSYDYWVYDDYGQEARQNLLTDDSIPTLEYDETYTARLGAYNYGDWGLDGVKFIYILPKGTSPLTAANGGYQVTAYAMTGGDSYDPAYTAIDPSKVTVNVLQQPGQSNGYQSPKRYQDPWLSQIAEIDTEDYTDTYYDTADSWVLEIIVQNDLNQWFGRGSGSYGYMMRVDVRCRVDETNENEYWYDQVLATPYENTADGHNDSLYYQIYDVTSYQGATRDKSDQASGPLSTQYGGMDYLWDGFDNANGVDTATNYNNGSPNMPYINGYNIQNKELLVNGNNGVEFTGTRAYYGTGNTTSWASTGTRAYMRKPFIRTWTTLGDDNGNLSGDDLNAYYLEVEGDKTTMNIHVENKYWWNDLATNDTSVVSEYWFDKDFNASLRQLHNYSTDGGNEGTLFFPVVTSILPEGVVPVDTDGVPYTQTNAVSGVNRALAWTLYDDSSAPVAATEQDLYTALVELIQVPVKRDDGTSTGETEARYKITFYQDRTTQGTDPDAQILSGDRRIFSYDIITVGEPDKSTPEAETSENSGLLAQYQTANVYITSQLKGFKFLIDSDVPGNPYYVGAPYDPYYADKYNTGDPRDDAIRVRSYWYGHDDTGSLGGVLPNSVIKIPDLGQYYIIDAVEDKGVKRYYENATPELVDGVSDLENYVFNLEDYTHLRYNVMLTDTQKDFNKNGTLVHTDEDDTDRTVLESGVTTSMRIRTTHPRLEAETKVSYSSEIEKPGLSGTKTSIPVEHYPEDLTTNEFELRDDIHMQYGDTLWYSTTVTNAPASETDYSHKGAVQHAKIVVSVKLPSIVSYKNEYLLQYTDDTGAQHNFTADELRNDGWQINLIDTVEDPVTKEETRVFEIITPGTATTYLDYITGKGELPGYFASGDSFVFKLRTVIDNLPAPETVTSGEDHWDNNYYAESYVTLHQTNGAYLTNIDGLANQSMDRMEMVQEVWDKAPDAAAGTEAIDYDSDEDYTERYASDRSARVTVLKPTANLRLDTSVQRLQLNNPDASRPVTEDAGIKGAARTMVYLDQTVNTGGAVGEFIVDYRIPHRGTTGFSRDVAPKDADVMETTIYAIRTGTWEIPDLGDTVYEDALRANLKVYVYALIEDEDKVQTADYADPGPTAETGDYTDTTKWIALGKYALDDNMAILVNMDEDPNAYAGQNYVDKRAELDQYKNRILQVRFVVRADDSQDDEATQKYPVPQGFRLSIDADDNPDNGAQEMDQIDPYRYNLKPLPASVIGNAAYVKMSIMHDSIDVTGRRHVNTLAKVWARYDDTQYSGISDQARAGYYVNAQYPVITKELEPYYYHYYSRYVKDENGETVRDENGKPVQESGFEWSDTEMTINQSMSTMLMFRSSITNLHEEKLVELGIDEKEDNASYPIISAVLPHVQDIDRDMVYVPADSEKYETAFVNTAFTSNLAIDATNYPKVYPEGHPTHAGQVNPTPYEIQWTYYVLDKDGQIVTNPKITGFTFETYEKIAFRSDVRDRKILTWKFQGYLEPGQTIVVDYMVPISAKDYGLMSDDLMTTGSYAYLGGSFRPYVPSTDSGTESFGLETDPRDINNNNKKESEPTLVKKFWGLGFANEAKLTRVKYAYSEYDTKGFDDTRPALVPEGTDYKFMSAVLNPGTLNTPGYKQVILYDVLPYPNDITLVSDSPGSRGSTWAGWLLPETVTVSKLTAGASTKTDILEEGTHYEAWIGPFEKLKNGTIVDKSAVVNGLCVHHTEHTSDCGYVEGVAACTNTTCAYCALPTHAQTSDTSVEETSFYASMYASETMRRKYFVKLSELLALKQSDYARYTELSKKIQAIWVQMKDVEGLELNGSTKYELNYSLHAPLNLPQYPGAITADMADKDVLSAVSAYTGWNSFSTQSRQVSGGLVAATTSPKAGVYLDAPIEKGYIGSYVWYDGDYDGEFVGDGDYEQRGKGRWIFQNATKDLDYDGTLDDPGINGVVVELLNENGYPVNKMGEAVTVLEEDGEIRYVLIDETTGKMIIDQNGHYVYTTHGPATYTTEADAYGNNGYFIISNVEPGDYKLRYTFPKDTYNQYALTTLSIGADDSIPMDIYRPGDTLPDLGATGTGDVPSDAMPVVDRLVVQTRDSITVEAIGTDTTKYESYDAKMTSYNVGVTRAYVYGGYAWVDMTEVGNDEWISDGLIGNNEQKLANVEVNFYKVDAEGNLELAKNVEGGDATVTTGADGYFEIRLYPGKYIARAIPPTTDGMYKPSPITLNLDPHTQDNDNDLKISTDKRHYETFDLNVDVQFKNGQPIRNEDGNYGTYKCIGLGFVEAGRGYIGKYVWDDKNYDGIRGSYVDDTGAVLLEPGIPGVKLILEKYYYDDATGKWVDTGERKTQSSTGAGSYTFQNVLTYHDPLGDGNLKLAGYKVRVDLVNLPNGYKDYLATKFHMNTGKQDSDLPVVSPDGYLLPYGTEDVGTDNMLIIAEKTDVQDAKNVREHNGQFYDLNEGKMLMDLDAGLVKDESKITISGIVWDDKNYNGIQDQYENAAGAMVDEPTIKGIQVVIEQYYYNGSTWVLKQSMTVTTDNKTGVYQKTGLPSYLTEQVDGESVNYLAGYKVRLPSLKGYAATQRLVGSNKTIDSNLYESDLYLRDPADTDDYIIVADKILTPNYDKEYIISNTYGHYDIVKAHDNADHDAGLVAYGKTVITGKVWNDANYDGVHVYEDENGNTVQENGIGSMKIVVEQHYYDGSGWQQNNSYKSPNVATKPDGSYTVPDLVAYVEVNGTKYLAGYKLKLASLNGYAATQRLVGNDKTIDSDLRASDLYLMDADTYIILADKYDPDPKPGDVYHNMVEGEDGYYDIVRVNDVGEYDAGLVHYGTAAITGKVWDDANYDGVHVYEDENGLIVDETGISGMEIVVEQHYYDGSGWHQNNSYIAPNVKTIGNGSYTVPDLAAYVEVNGTKYLAGYKLKLKDLNRVTYAVTQRWEGSDRTIDSDLVDSTLYLMDADTYIILADKYVPDPDPNRVYHNMVEGEDGYYDIVKTNAVGDYDAGLVVYGTGVITGFVWDDANYDGVHVYEDDTGNTVQEEGIPDIEIIVEQYYRIQIDGKYKWEPVKDYSVSAKTDSDGIYTVPAQPTYVTVNGVNYLAGYKLKVDSIGDYAVTQRLAGTDRTIDSDLIASNLYLMNDNANDYIILAGRPLNPDSGSYNMVTNDLGSFDIVKSHDTSNYDAGLVNYGTADITGFVWDDANYDGVHEYEAADGSIVQEDGISGVEIVVEQYYYKDSKWNKVETYFVSETTDAAGNPVYIKTVTTDANGEYKVPNQATYVEVDGTKYLAGYTLKLASLNGYAATQRLVGNNRTIDSDLYESDLYLMDPADEEAYIILADELNAPVAGRYNMVTNKLGSFDIVKANGVGDYDAGLVHYGTADITGFVWDDANYDGVHEYEAADGSIVQENGIPNVEVVVEQYYRKGSEWIKVEGYFVSETTDASGNPVYIDTVTTGADGKYVVPGQPTYVEVDGIKYLAGYTLKLASLNGYAATQRLVGNNRTIDSDLYESDLYLMDPAKEEAYIILADKYDPDPDPNRVYHNMVKNDLGYYDIVKANGVGDYDAGLVHYGTADITGFVWDDANYDGVHVYEDENGDLVQEDGISGVEIVVEQYYRKGSEWIKVEGYFVSETTDADGNPVYIDTVTTDADGKYVVPNQPTYVEVEGTKYLAGYTLKLKELDRVKYAVTQRLVGDDRAIDSDLVDSTLYLMDLTDPDAYIILADEYDTEPDRDYHNMVKNDLGCFDIVKANDVGDYDAGLVHYGTADITGRVWEDKNYDGIQNQYEDEAGVLADEPGIPDVEIIVEQYYYKDSVWHLNEDYVLVIETEPGEDGADTETDPTDPDGDGTETNPTDPDGGGNGTETDPTDPDGGGNGTETDPTDPDGGGNGTETDPTDPDGGGNGTETDPTDPDGDGDGTETDPTDPDGDGDGTETDPTDPDGDGSDTETDPADPDEGTEDTNVVITDESGDYVVPDQATYVTIDGVNYLAGYKLKLKELDREEYAVTYRLAGDPALDSDLVDSTLYLMEGDDCIILADKLDDPAAGRYNVVENDLGSFDIVRANDAEHYDAGLVTYRQADLSGKIWDDKSYDGILNQINGIDEPGLEDIALTLHQYYLDKNGVWHPVPEDMWAPEEHRTATDENGDYSFTDLDAHVLIDGNHYLAGYKVLVDETTIPSPIYYGITLYRVPVQAGERDSDLNDAYEIYNGSAFAVVAADVTDAVMQNTPYIAVVDGRVYDYISAADNEANDGGFTQFQGTDIQGSIFEDKNGNGIIDENDGYENLKQALAEGQRFEVLLTAHYLDKDGVWKPLLDENGEPDVRTAIVGEDGSYLFEDLPTHAYLLDAEGSGEVTYYLTGYKLYLNLVPQDYRAAEHMANAGVDDSALYVAADGTLALTKTLVGLGYAGTEFEELDGYIIAAAYCGEDSNVSKRTTLHGYDLLRGKTLAYNAGFEAVERSPLTGENRLLLLLPALLMPFSALVIVLLIRKRKKQDETV